MKKRILSIILSAVMAFSVMPISAVEVMAESSSESKTSVTPNDEWAKENGWNIIVSGRNYEKCIDNIEYELFYGWDVHENADEVPPSWKASTASSTNAAGDIIIPSHVDGIPVKAIGRDTFRANQNITSCIIPEGVELVGVASFYLCKNLKSVQLPSTLEMIDAMAFNSCDKLNTIVIPSLVNKVARNAFYRANTEGIGIEKIIFEGNAPEILYTSDEVGYSMSGLDGVSVKIYPEATGWDAEVWSNLDISIIKFVENLYLNEDAIEIVEGSTYELIATVEPEDAEGELVWTSSDESVATVEDGIVTGVSEGEAVITATFDTLSVSAKVMVEELVIDVTGIELSDNKIEVCLGQEYIVEAMITPKNATNKDVVWTSSNEDVVIVEDGVITTVGMGATQITATCGGYSATASVMVLSEDGKFPGPTDILLDVGSEIVMEVGDSITVNATIVPSYAVYKKIEWVASDELVITVDQNGVITAVGEGLADVFIYCDNIETSIFITVNPKEEAPSVDVTGITVDKEAVTLKEGETSTVVATVMPEDATNKDVIWTVEDKTVATVTNGVITGVSAGTTTVTASCDEFSATVIVTVTENDEVVPPTVDVTGITLDKELVELEIGKTATVVATVTPEDATNKEVFWRSEEETVATVEDGVITAIGEGTTTITASCGEFSATVVVTVTKAEEEKSPVVDVTGITVDKETLELKVGETGTVVVTVMPEDATNKDVVWTSNDEAVATVEDGVITGVSEGTTKVTASCGEFIAIVEVTVIDNEEVTDKKLPFTDVAEESWYFDYVCYVYEKKLMEGFSETLFSPDVILSREDFVTVLWRMEGSPETEYKCNFEDVKQGSYYSDAINWATENGMVEGYTEKCFGTLCSITREELATILYRYFGEEFDSAEQMRILDKFSDSDQVSHFAKDAMGWCVEEGIIEGETDTILNPRGVASRAVCAAMFARLIK